MIFEYVRDKKRRKVGVVVALDANIVGWSKCNIKKDRFIKDFGINIACGRAVINSKVKVPHTISPAFENMKERAKRYFKPLA